MLTVVLIALIANLIFDFVTDGEPSTASYLDIVVLASMTLFAWSPPIAAAALTASATVGLFIGAGEPYALALAVASGLVVYLCSAAVVVAYCVVTAILAISAEVLDQGVAAGASVGVLSVGVASGMVGWAIRRQRAKVTSLNADVDRLAREVAQAVAMERERIADELHDVVAHDITILLMHTRALRLVDDASGREASLQAISKAATQAMTDVRRMLRVVDSNSESADSPTTSPGQIRSRIEKIAEEFRTAGVRVETMMSDDLVVSSIVEATLWHIVNECATNIMKHAPDSRSVRFELVTSPAAVTLTVWNGLAVRRPGAPAGLSGYGLRRMAERVLLLGGSFDADRREDGWRVEAVLPRA